MMRSKLAFGAIACFCLLFLASAKTAAPLVAHLNAEDEVTNLGWRLMARSQAPDMPMKSHKEDKTPESLQAAIKETFYGSPNVSWIFNHFTRGAKLSDYCGCEAMITYSINDRTPVPVQDPCKLNKGTYTFVMTADGQLTFGAPENKLEWGTKHVHLADYRPSYGAGELEVNEDGKLYWNLKSGCINKPLVAELGAAYNEVLHQKISKVWEAASCADKFVFHPDPLLEERDPTLDEVWGYCQHVGAKHYDRLHLTNCKGKMKRHINETICKSTLVEKCLWTGGDQSDDLPRMRAWSTAREGTINSPVTVFSFIVGAAVGVLAAAVVCAARYRKQSQPEAQPLLGSTVA